jgi:hypothetical protein
MRPATRRTLIQWWARPTALVVEWPPIPDMLRWSLLVMAAGVSVSGLRDLYAALELPFGAWPWKPETRAAPGR